MADTSLQIAFRGVDHSDALEQAIRKRVAWLEQFHPQIQRCRVLIEIPHRHHGDVRHFHTTVEVTVPGAPTLVVNQDPSLHQAFDTMRRQLQDAARETRGDMKMHRTASRES
jgi:ribosome-associated translation inhibitor RaiA